jgi:tetratricopeptide (TPR) repeat protein
MSDVLSRELPAPRRWQELESLAFDVYGRLWKTTDAELHGRTGQPQSGVDVYGTNRVENFFTGVQCKGKARDYAGQLTEAELRAEVDKALTFSPPLDVYIVLTTAPNDAGIQKVAREITIAHKKLGLFEVRVTGWDTFRHHVASHPDLLMKYFADFAPVDVVGQISAASHQNAQGFIRVEGMLHNTQRLISDIRDNQVGGDELATRIAEVSRLVNDGSPIAAMRALERIEAEEIATASPLAKYRLLAGKGNAYFALGQDAKALAQFREAYAAYPDYPNAQATLAIVHHFEGNHDEAFRLAKDAVAASPTSARNVGILIDTAPPGMPPLDLEALVGPDLLSDFEVKLRLAIHAAKAGDFARHKLLAEEALAASPDDWRALSAVGEALMQPLNALDGLGVTHALPDEYRADVERATALMKAAWAKLVVRDSTSLGRHVAANLISLLELSGRGEEADAILDEALVSNAAYGPLTIRAARRAASLGDWPSVAVMLDALSDLPEEGLSFDGALLRVQAALALGQPEVALDFCDRLDRLAAGEPPMPERDDLIAALRVRAAIAGGADHDAAIRDAIAARAQSIVLRSILFDELAADDPLRAQIAEEIGQLASRAMSLQERIHAAETLYAAGSYLIAADIYAPLHGKTDSFALRRRLQALHLADRRADARKLFETLPKDLRSSPGYRNLGVSVYERAGLLKPALALTEKALEAEDDLQMRLAWMQLLTRLGQPERYREWLEQVSDEIDGAPGELLALAQIIDQEIGRDPRSLALGYRGLRASYNRPRSHMVYALGLALIGRPAPEQMESLETVVVGSGVHLVDDETGDELFRVIDAVTDPVIERGELSADDPFALKLLGLKTGDLIEVDRLGTSRRSYRVEAIQTKYAHAAQRTLRDFQRLFPGNPALGTFELDETRGENQFDELFAMARRRAGHGAQIEKLYRENPLPLPTVAKFAGTNLFELWDAFSRDPTLGLKSAIGAAEEFVAGRKAARGAVIVVDPASLYAWTRMEIAETIKKTGIRLAVVQSTIDALRELVEEREGRRGQRSGTFGFDGERYAIVELGQDVIDAKLQAAKDALAFAQSLLLIPAEADKPVPPKIMSLIDEYHPAYRDTLLAGTQPNRTLLTDELGLRIIAQEIGLSVTWTQALAQAGHASSAITHPEYRGVVAALIDANYAFTQFGAAEVLGELLESGWQINEQLETYARMMTSATLDRGSIGQLLAQLMLDSHQPAPDAQAYAAFHIAFTRAMRSAGRNDDLLRDYENALRLAKDTMVRNANRMLLRGLLLESTSLTPPFEVSRDLRRVAHDQTRGLFSRLQEGGLELRHDAAADAASGNGK